MDETLEESLDVQFGPEEEENMPRCGGAPFCASPSQ